MSNGIRIRVKGKVQGVGFRPYVWQLAHRYQLCGNVSNDSAGVLIHLVMSPLVALFLDDLARKCPPLAHIDSIESHPYEWEQESTDFRIAHSGAGAMDTQVVPDAATCPACLQELMTPGNRRYHYPLINCTHCGRVLPLFAICLTTGLIQRWRRFLCVRRVPVNTKTLPTDAFMPNRRHAQIVGHTCGCAMPAVMNWLKAMRR